MQQVFTADQRATHEVECDLSGLLRADPEVRWKSHEIAVKAGILTANEIREIEGFSPLPDGDRLTAAAQPAATPRPNGAAQPDDMPMVAQ